ncbi:MAG TPA: NAD(P)-dependent oxidoreductase [Candidatus Limnocylindrales bacterium]|nr:NAD(P)-dependent oxidoreductase [Candidatus Limnocylindrales bacterium]
MSPGRLLVVGAGGFLGTHVRRALAAAAWDDVTFVSGSEAAPAGAAAADGGTGRWHRLDLATADRTALAPIIAAERPVAIVNCSGTTRGDAARLVRGNVVLVGELLAAAADAARGARFVQLGSSAEYGAVEPGTAIDEATPANPLATYGVTKLAGTELALAAGRTGAVDAVVLRVFNPIGGGMTPSSLPGRAAAVLRGALAAGERRIALGSLEDHRDFVDVGDVAEAVVAAAAAPERLGPRILNVGSGRATRARELVAQLAAVAGFDGEIAEDQASSPRSSAVPWQQADISSIASTLGWRPRRTLAQAVEAVWRDAEAAARR